MTGPIPIKTPAGYATPIALGFAAPDNSLTSVRSDQPLPVTFDTDHPLMVQMVSGSGAPAPMKGELTDSAMQGPYTPAPGLPVLLTLSGDWQGEVRILRSTDQGATRSPLTAAGFPWAVFTDNACEPVWIENDRDATLYLDAAIESGTLSYRLAQ